MRTQHLSIVLALLTVSCIEPDVGPSTDRLTDAAHENDGGLDGGSHHTDAGDAAVLPDGCVVPKCDSFGAEHFNRDMCMCEPCAKAGECAQDTTVCFEGHGCVECTHEDATFCESQNKVCATDDSNKCVECNTSKDCPADVPICDNHECRTCALDPECGERGNSMSPKRDLICDTAEGSTKGQCVGCKKDRLENCGKSGVQYSCDFETHECTQTKIGMTPACGRCRSDSECVQGAVCVLTSWNDDGESTTPDVEVGWFCQSKKGNDVGAFALCNSSARPYIQEHDSTTADGASVQVCELGTSTCEAHQSFRKACGRAGDRVVEDITKGADGNDIIPALNANDVVADDSVCGEGGKCVTKKQTEGAYRCTVGCGNSDIDCPVGSFTCGGAPPSLPNLCSI